MVRLGVTPLVADVNKGLSMEVVTWPALLWHKILFHLQQTSM
jgi:hypothetical protein